MNRYLFVLLGTFALIGAETLRDIAKKECPEGAKDNVLQSGMEYRYMVKMRATTEVSGTTDQKGTVDMSCELAITHVRACFYELMVDRCKVQSFSGPPGGEVPLIPERELAAMSNYPVLFSLSHGHLHKILAHPNDHIGALNIKRGIISFFGIPASGEEEHEIHLDVQGNCPRTVTREGDIIRTTKDMVECDHPSRHDWQLSPFSMAWNISFLNFLINETNECEYKLNVGEKRVEKAICHERSAAIPYSTQDTQITCQTNLHYELIHEGSKKTSKKSTEKVNELRLAGIEYEHEHTPDPTSNPPNFEANAQRILRDLVLDSQDEIHLGSIAQYHDFIAYLRTGSDILPFVKSVTTCTFLENCDEKKKETAKQFLQGALVQCNTIGCMKAITHLTVYEHISPTYLNIVLYSWANLVVTKPEYLDEILGICKSRDYRLCWLSLGSAISNYIENNPEVMESGQLPNSVVSAVDHLASYLGDRCNIEETNFPPDFTPLQKYDYMRGIIKAIGNIGEVARIAKPDIPERLHRCARNDDLHRNVRVAAIESLERMKGSQDIYNILMGVLRDREQPVDIRLAAYQALAHHLADYDISSDIATLLKDEHVTQVKTYIVSHLRNLVEKQHPTDSEKEFIAKLKQTLEANGVDLDDVYVDPLLHSHNIRRGFHFKIPNLPRRDNEFGYEVDDDVLFTPESAIPYSVTSNITLELFSQLLHLMEAGVTYRDWEAFEIWGRRLSVDASGPQKWLEDNAFEIFQRLGLMGDMAPTEPEVAFLDQRARDGIKRLKDSYYQTFKKQYPTFMVNLKTFGTEVDFGTLQDVFTYGQGQYFLMATTQPMGSLKDGLEYQANRAARLLEGYHYIPTQIGIPLNWTMNFTAMYSLKGKLRMDTSGQVDIRSAALSGSVGLHPSAAATLTSRMVLDLPQVTMVGFQSNVSLYHSTRWDLDFIYSHASNTRKFSLRRPEEPQRYLEIYRTGYILKNDEMEHLPDNQGLERVHVKDCTREETSAALGFEVCRERTHVDVTNRPDMPWFPMAGDFSWKLYSHPYDRELKAYTLFIEETKIDPEYYSIHAKLEGPGSMYRREVDMNLKVRHDKGDTHLDVRVPEKPEFHLSVTATQNVEDDVRYSILRDYLLKLDEGKKYQIKYKANVVRDKDSTYRRPIFTREGALSIETPNNYIEATSEGEANRNGGKLDIDFKATNKNPDMHVLKEVLPKHWWESDREAWMKFHLVSINTQPEATTGFYRRGSATVETPMQVTELEGKLERRNDLERLWDLHLTCRDKATQELKTFADLYLDITNHTEGDNNDITGIFNLTLPRLSLAANYKRECTPNKLVRRLDAKRVKLIPKTEEARHFIGFYTPDEDALFEREERNLKLRMDLDMYELGVEDLPQVVRNLYQSGDPLLWGRRTEADVELIYPFHEKEHVVTLKGTFKRFMYDGHFLSWDRNYKVAGTGTQLEMDTNGHYVNSQEFEIGDLIEDSTITYLPTGGKTIYQARSERRKDADGCLKFHMGHSLTSDLINFAADHKLDCYPGNLDITIKTDSPHWDKLNFDLKYKGKVGPEGNMDLEWTGPLTHTKVTGDWTIRDDDYRLTRHVVVNSHSDLIPSHQTDLEMNDGNVRLESSIPEMRLQKIRMLRRVVDDTKLERIITHVDTDSDEEHEDLYMKIKLYNPTTFMVRGTFRPEIFNRYFWFFRRKIAASRQRIRTALRDPDHPLNKMLEPYLHMTVFDKYVEIREHIHHDAETLGNNAVEAVRTLRPVYWPYVEVVFDLKEDARQAKMKADEWFHQKSLTGWSLRYFGVRETVEDKWEDREELSKKVEDEVHELSHTYDNRAFNFDYTGQHPFYWKSARKYPKWSKERFMAWSNMKYLQSDMIIPEIQPTKLSKTGGGFGLSHVRTFDGVQYELPELPARDCSYLVAHDVRGSSFSLIADGISAFKVVFPEVTVRITTDGKIYLNGFREEQAVPYKTPNGKVTVTREGRVVKVETDGLTVLCELSPDMCWATIGPMYRGGVIGLLGNADGETYNDFMLPDGTLTTDIGKFVSEYEIGDKSQCKSVSARPHPTWTKAEKDACHGQLGLGSPLLYSACIGTLGIDEEALEESCMWQIRKGKDKCDVEEGISALCYLNGIRITPDKMCLLKRGLKEEPTRVAKQLEVVLVVNQNVDMFPSGLKGLEVLVKNIQRTFEGAGFEKIDYGLIGFGDKSGHSHIYTPTTNLLMDQNTLVSQTFGKLEFLGVTDRNPIDAVRYAANMIPHSTTAARIYLLFNNHDLTLDMERCGVRNFRQCLIPIAKSALERYTRLGRLALSMKARGDAVFSFAMYPSLEEKKVFGVRNPINVETIPRGAEDVSYPSGDGATLAAMTGGAAFELTYVQNNQPPAFFKEAAQEMLHDVSEHVDHCRECKPSYGPLWDMRNSCVETKCA